MLANVTYDRSDRVYAVAHPETGEVVETFPAGTHGRRQAFRAAVQLVDPEIYQRAGLIIAKHPHLEARVWKAAELVVHGRVWESDSDLYVAAVESQSSEHGNYILTSDRRGLLSCDCLDFTDFTAPFTEGSLQAFCKHILAWKLYAATKLPY